ncbi:MAG TPA: hypothetical protein VNN72_03380, partial [Polyangiaceae bacterium]|nr:hypothetical protein [Polyangiaceae bacterium]
QKKDDLAYAIAENHYLSVLGSFERTGSIWEHHAPDAPAEGRGRKDFVGWTAITPIAVLFEYVLGFRADAVNGELFWDLRRTDEHGVYRYPFGAEGSVDLIAAARADANERPALTIKSNVAFRLRVRWAGGEDTIDVAPT